MTSVKPRRQEGGWDGGGMGVRCGTAENIHTGCTISHDGEDDEEDVRDL